MIKSRALGAIKIRRYLDCSLQKIFKRGRLDVTQQWEGGGEGWGFKLYRALSFDRSCPDRSAHTGLHLRPKDVETGSNDLSRPRGDSLAFAAPLVPNLTAQHESVRTWLHWHLDPLLMRLLYSWKRSLASSSSKSKIRYAWALRCKLVTLSVRTLSIRIGADLPNLEKCGGSEISRFNFSYKRAFIFSWPVLNRKMIIWPVLFEL
ncbi:hypothetical protein RRG08_040363 [Elysia crispata]|uniref:Uncharacterized protein n=1 Tax=Elysia crispata TaxID=231223 RepID=A0AAE1DRI2_9GAST|nr:hypothetical protein RRG08_040363 [Elysia crispata]